MYVPQTNFNFQVFNLLAQVNYLGVRYDLHVPENLQAGDTFHVSVSLPPKLATWHVKKHVKNMLDISCVSEAKAKGMKIEWVMMGSFIIFEIFVSSVTSWTNSQGVPLGVYAGSEGYL